MNSRLKIRRYAQPDDLQAIEQVVSNAVLECYGHLLSDYRFDAAENWSGSWVAENDGKVVGVVLTGGDWVEDLWIAASHRQLGIGTRLLAIAENEIADRGHDVGRLRVVSENARALQFYSRRGWSEASRYPHEINGFEMAEMTKRLVAYAP
jgi:GNAT superfamily N-acetyltransferase